MNKKSLIAILPIMAALTLTGCTNQEAAQPAPSSPAVVAPVPPIDPLPLAPVETPRPEPTAPTDAEMAANVKFYNEEVDASNNKAKDVLEAYTGQIESVTGK